MPDFAKSHVGVDGVLDQLLAREGAQDAAGAGALELDGVVVGIERGVVAHGFERDASRLGLVLVVILGIEVGDEVQRGITRAEIQQADLRVAAAVLVAAAAGAERSANASTQRRRCIRLRILMNTCHSICASERLAD